MKFLYKRKVNFQGKTYTVKEYQTDKGYLVGEWVCHNEEIQKRHDSEFQPKIISKKDVKEILFREKEARQNRKDRIKNAAKLLKDII